MFNLFQSLRGLSESLRGAQFNSFYFVHRIIAHFFNNINWTQLTQHIEHRQAHNTMAINIHNISNRLLYLHYNFQMAWTRLYTRLFILFFFVLWIGNFWTNFYLLTSLIDNFDKANFQGNFLAFAQRKKNMKNCNKKNCRLAFFTIKCFFCVILALFFLFANDKQWKFKLDIWEEEINMRKL